MKKRVLEKSWGGRGEHGFRYFDYERKGNNLIIYITVKDYDDWEGKSVLQDDKVKHMAFPIDGRKITREFVYECILTAGKELREEYLLPESPDELKI